MKRYRVTCNACSHFEDLPATRFGPPGLGVGDSPGLGPPGDATSHSGTCRNCGHNEFTAKEIDE